MVGDIDGNGQLDLADAIKVLQIASGIDVTGPIDVSFGDINQDNVIGIAEAIYALNAQLYPWTAEYFNTAQLTEPVVMRKEPVVAHDWGAGPPADGVNADNFSVRWRGTFDFDGTYEFATRADEGMRVWLGADQIMNHWPGQPSTTYAVKKELLGTHEIVVEYFENSGDAHAAFSWTPYLFCACNQSLSCESDCACDPDCAGQTVSPVEIDDILVNPGMGMSDFHFRWWCNLPPVTFTPEQCVERWNPGREDRWPENYPPAGSSYFRWHWKDIEPVQGQYNWDLIDTTIQTANLLGETLAIRIMTIDDSNGRGIPDWLTVPGQTVDGIFWPDYRDAAFQQAHADMVAALAQRYDKHPGLDHVDIGAVGCWGEWNTACLSGVGDIFEIFNPQSEADYQAIVTAYNQLIEHYTDAFVDTPLVMLGINGDHEVEVMTHALERGAGWRVDCWGDWWNFSPNWSHMEDSYPAMIAQLTAAYPDFPNVYQHAPIELEICGTMPGWHDLGYSAGTEVRNSFQWALDQHASLLNFKSTDIHEDYVGELNNLLRQNGYRYVIDQFRHPATAFPGDRVRLSSRWRNIGVAPNYNRRYLTYRLRSAGRVEHFESSIDTRQWLPGTFEVADIITLPPDLPAGSYFIDAALLDKAAINPVWIPLPPIHLAIQGRMVDGWYPLSQIMVE